MTGSYSNTQSGWYLTSSQTAALLLSLNIGKTRNTGKNRRICVTKHHRLPKQFTFKVDKFYDQRSKANTLKVSEAHHRAWNLLTHNSQMTCGEIAASLSRFIPDDLVFVVLKRQDLTSLKEEVS